MRRENEVLGEESPPTNIKDLKYFVANTVLMESRAALASSVIAGATM